MKNSTILSAVIESIVVTSNSGNETFMKIAAKNNAIFMTQQNEVWAIFENKID